MKALFLAFACSAVSLSVALAETPAKLPGSARQLTKAEIVSLYDNKPYDWMHPSGDKGHGTTKYVARTETSAAPMMSAATPASGRERSAGRAISIASRPAARARRNRFHDMQPRLSRRYHRL